MSVSLTPTRLAQTEAEVSALITMLIADEGMDIATATDHAIKAIPQHDRRQEFVLAASGGTLALIGTQTHRIADLSAP